MTMAAEAVVVLLGVVLLFSSLWLQAVVAAVVVAW
jgi:hypothetical protein